MDVLQSFSLPMHRVKQDAVPGLTIPVWFDSIQSTWEYQASGANYTAEDVIDITRLQSVLNEGKTPALAFLKDAIKLPADPKPAAVSQALNEFLVKPGFYETSRFPPETLSFELKQLIATQPTENIFSATQSKAVGRDPGGFRPAARSTL